MPTKKYDVVAICNALVDILVSAEEKHIKELGLTKGIMHLVDATQQSTLLQHFSEKPKTLELGGSAMNAMRSLAALGSHVVFAGMIGKDEFGELIHDRMHNLGIVPKLLWSEAATGSCAILITPDGERTMNTCLGASCLFDESIVPNQEIAEAKIFHFCGYQWDTAAQKAAITRAMDTAKENGTLISFDLADPFVVNRHREEFLGIIERYADIVFANKAEAELLTQGHPEQTAKMIASLNALAVIKLGAEGAMVQQGSKTIKVSPVATQVIDTTAAGDMFAAGFLYGMTKGWTLELCGKAAATLASDVISRVGARVSDQGFTAVRSLG